MGYKNSQTDVDSRDFSTTPDPIVEWATRKYGCDVDLAAVKENKKFAFYFGPDPDPLDADLLGNGLTDQWHTPLRPERRCGWLNPPYSNITPWVKKAVDEAVNGFTSVVLLPTLNGEEWGRWCFFAREIIFIIGRIQFLDYRTMQPILNTKGKPGGNNRGSMLCIFGPHSQSSPSISYIHRDQMT